MCGSEGGGEGRGGAREEEREEERGMGGRGGRVAQTLPESRKSRSTVLNGQIVEHCFEFQPFFNFFVVSISQYLFLDLV